MSKLPPLAPRPSTPAKRSPMRVSEGDAVPPARSLLLLRPAPAISVSSSSYKRDGWPQTALHQGGGWRCKTGFDRREGVAPQTLRGRLSPHAEAHAGPVRPARLRCRRCTATIGATGVAVIHPQDLSYRR